MTAPLERRVTRYVCPFCHRGHSKKPAAVEHVAVCFRNPERRACPGCVHFKLCCTGFECGCAGEPYCDVGLPFPCDESPHVAVDCEQFVPVPHFARAAEGEPTE